jgi:hypothetical protein
VASLESKGTGPSTLEGRREAAVHEYLYGMDRRPRNHDEAAYVPRLAYMEQHLRDLVRLRRVRERIDREYAQPLDVEALARGVYISTGHLSRQFRRASKRWCRWARKAFYPSSARCLDSWLTAWLRPGTAYNGFYKRL